MEADAANIYLHMAEEVSVRSTCSVRHVGAIIVRDEATLCTGWNGVLRLDASNCIEVGCPRCSATKRPSGTEYDTCICMHAEQSAICIAAKEGVSLVGSTLYCTLRPCLQCVSSALCAGVTRVVYAEEWMYEDPTLENLHLLLRSRFVEFRCKDV